MRIWKKNAPCAGRILPATSAMRAAKRPQSTMKSTDAAKTTVWPSALPVGKRKKTARVKRKRSPYILPNKKPLYVSGFLFGVSTEISTTNGKTFLKFL